jgi:mRNA-degrading endonuclease RelE of RelBE toxin-antitoxin system
MDILDFEKVQKALSLITDEGEKILFLAEIRKKYEELSQEDRKRYEEKISFETEKIIKQAELLGYQPKIKT